MQYKSYRVEDFLFDEFFVKWVKNPGPETEHFWHSWIENNPDQLEVINHARDIINSIEPRHQFKPSTKDYEEVLENILKQPSSWSRIGYNKKNDSLTSWVKYAAVILVFLTFGGIVTFLELTQEPEYQAHSIEKSNPFGQKSTFELSDGTIVKLNAGSKLIFPDKFGETERKVILEGEAFFKVSRDESRPFLVQTEDLTTIVLGTSFNVRSYDDESTTSVAVASGKVKVMKSNEMDISGSEYLLLEANQKVSFNSADNSLMKTESIPEAELAWVDNTILFNHTEFAEVQQTLSRWYGVEFEIHNKNAFVGGFNGRYTNETLQIVLEGLKDEGQYNFEFEINGKKVTIY